MVVVGSTWSESIVRTPSAGIVLGIYMYVECPSGVSLNDDKSVSLAYVSMLLLCSCSNDLDDYDSYHTNSPISILN